MKKRIFEMVLLSLLVLSGCSGELKSPTKDTVPLESAAMVTEAEETQSFVFSESKQQHIPVISNSEVISEEAEVAETTTEKPEIIESKPQSTTALPTENKVTESSPKKPNADSSPVLKEKHPSETKPVEIQPQETQPKTAYDLPFDTDAIKSDCIGIGKGMGLTLDTSLTTDNATWWTPVTASQSNQGGALKRSLERYITFHTVDNLGAYGIDEIKVFNIYCEANGNNSYSFYFLFA